MKNLEKELEEFKKFKKDFKYEVKEVEEKDGVEVYEGESLIDENGKEKGEGENWINVGYKHSGPYAKVLSNLFPYEFVFKGKKLNSIESFFQGIKFKDPQLQDIHIWRVRFELYTSM